MRVWKKAALGVTLVGASSLTGIYSMSRAGKADAPQVRDLAAKDFNHLQRNSAALAAALASPASLRGSGVRVYELMSCPFCSQIKAVLEFHGVPYDTVVVDPVNFNQMDLMPYRAVPQIQMTARPTAAEPDADMSAAVAEFAVLREGPMIADSDEILTRLAAPLGFAAQLADPRVAARREWISTTMARCLFGVTFKTYGRALEMYPGVVPPQYGFVGYKVVGAGVLRLLAGFKVIPKLKIDVDVDIELGRQLAAFRADFAGAAFHGGAAPDVVDVTLYGLLRVNAVHSAVGPIVRDSGLDAWMGAMKAATLPRQTL
jgi:glutathione S-transferase